MLIAGGGVAALEAVLALRELAADRVSIEVLAPEQHFWYRPLAVAAPFELGEAARFELATLVHDLGATLTLGGLTGIDEWRHVAHTSRNTEIVRQVPADQRKRDELVAATGSDVVPVLVLEDGTALEGEERILAYLGEHYLEPRGAWMHRARAKKSRRRYLEEECECSLLATR